MSPLEDARSEIFEPLPASSTAATNVSERSLSKVAASQSSYGSFASQARMIPEKNSRTSSYQQISRAKIEPNGDSLNAMFSPGQIRVAPEASSQQDEQEFSYRQHSQSDNDFSDADGVAVVQIRVGDSMREGREKMNVATWHDRPNGGELSVAASASLHTNGMVPGLQQQRV